MGQQNPVLFGCSDWTNTEVVSDAGLPCGACQKCTNCCATDKGYVSYCGKGSPDTGAHICAFPDIDHTSPKVQNDVIAWLKWLKVGDFSGEQRVAAGDALGFQGWRFDLVTVGRGSSMAELPFRLTCRSYSQASLYYTAVRVRASTASFRCLQKWSTLEPG